MTAIAVQPAKLDIGGVIRNTFEVLGRNLPAFLGAAVLLVGVPGAISSAWFAGTVHAGQIFSPALGVTGLVGVVTSAILQAALIYGTVQDRTGGRASIGDCLSSGLRSFFPLIVVSILFGVALVAGFVLLIVPGVMMACAWIVAVPALVAERTGVLGAFGRSAELTRGNRWRIFGLFVLWLLAVWAVQAVATLIGGVGLWQGGGLVTPLSLGLNVVVSTLMNLLGATGAAVLYVELRAAREGAGPEWLADIFS